MGNNMGAGSSKAAKVMKINGELLKLKTPAKVLDVIKDYPNHVLLDSQEFLRFNLRAKPLDPEDEIMPKKVYLLVELPKFPGPLRRVRSVLDVTTAGAATPRKTTQRSISDLSIMNTANLAAANTDSDDSVSIDGESCRARVKMRLPKVQMEKIMKESGDQAEIAQKILQLYLGDSLTRTGGDAVVDGGARGEERENVKDAEVRASCIPHGGYYRRKYKKLTL